MDAAMAWMREHKPALPEDVALCWGDARPGNQLYKDFEVQAVLDWEMVSLNDPVMDLAWWLFLDRHFTEGMGVGQPSGFLDRATTIARCATTAARCCAITPIIAAAVGL